MCVVECFVSASRYCDYKPFNDTWMNHEVTKTDDFRRYAELLRVSCCVSVEYHCSL